MEKIKATRLFFKDHWILAYFWDSNWDNFGYILGKVAKLLFFESPQNSLKTRQHLYQ